jgi:GTP-binding nuclear protein Ran
MAEKTYKLVIVGDGGVGKTAYLTKLLTGNFSTRYVPTAGESVHLLKIPTNKGLMKFEVHDTAGNHILGNLSSEKWDCAIIMFDLTSDPTYQTVSNWEWDSIDRGIINYSELGKHASVLCSRRPNTKYYHTSGKSGFQILDPILWLLKKLLNEDLLELL